MIFLITPQTFYFTNILFFYFTITFLLFSRSFSLNLISSPFLSLFMFFSKPFLPVVHPETLVCFKFSYIILRSETKINSFSPRSIKNSRLFLCDLRIYNNYWNCSFHIDWISALLVENWSQYILFRRDVWMHSLIDKLFFSFWCMCVFARARVYKRSLFMALESQNYWLMAMDTTKTFALVSLYTINQ